MAPPTAPENALVMQPGRSGARGRSYEEYWGESKDIAARATENYNRGQFSEAAVLFSKAADVLESAMPQFQTSPNILKRLTQQNNVLLTLASKSRIHEERRRQDRGIAQPVKDNAGVALNGPGVVGNGNGTEAADKTLVANAPEVHWDDIIGVETAKQAVREAVDVPLRFPNVFAQLKLRPWSGILLYGPPGTGKTMLAQAAAYETRCAFFNVKASDILSHLVGQSEKHVAELFARAQECAPAIIFLDECDSLLRARSDKESEAVMRVKTEFFTAMDGFLKTANVLVIAATNCYDQLDDAALRRFGKRIFVDVPDVEGRLAIFKRKIDGIETTCTDRDYADLARRTEGYTGSDIDKVLTEAKYTAIRRLIDAPCFRREPDGSWSPASPQDRQAYRLADTSTENFRVPLHMADILAALAVTPAVVSQEKLHEYRSQYEATQTQ